MKKTELGEICTIQNGYAFKSSEYVNEGIRVIRITNVQKGHIKDEDPKFYPKITQTSLGNYLICEGDILMSLTGNVGRVGVFPKKLLPAFLNQRVANIKPNHDKINPKYLFYYLNSTGFESEATNNSAGIAQLNLSSKWIEKHEIPLPPLATQRKIAEVLDKADAIRKRSQKILAKYDQLAQSVFLEMFGDPVKNERRWEVQELNTMLNFLTSGSRGWAKYYSDSGAIFLRIQNIGYNKLRLDNLTYVKSPDSAESKRTKVQAKDIILSITADLGRTAVIPDNFPVAHINQHLAIIRLKETFNPYFVSAYVATKGGQALLLKLNKGGVKDGLNFNDIKSYKVFSPPLRLQNQFAAIISQIESQKSQTQLELDRAEELYQSLLQRAFTGALFPETTHKELTHT
jgi:type I restriction enzyme S subunit